MDLVAIQQREATYALWREAQHERETDPCRTCRGCPDCAPIDERNHR